MSAECVVCAGLGCDLCPRAILRDADYALRQALIGLGNYNLRNVIESGALSPKALAGLGQKEAA